MHSYSLAWCVQRITSRDGKTSKLETVFSKLLYMPKGIEKLTGLRRLSELVISGGVDHDNKACTLEGLKILNKLEGSLTI